MHVVRGLWLPWWPTLWWEHRGKRCGRLLVADLLQLIGIGGAFTEAAAFNWHKLSEPQQRAVMRAYFAPAGEGGHAYAIGRHSAPEEPPRRQLPVCVRAILCCFIVANSHRLRTLSYQREHLYTRWGWDVLLRRTTHVRGSLLCAVLCPIVGSQ